MNIIMLMIPMALLLGVGFVSAFLWATMKGQFDDLETPAHRILEEENTETERKKT
ncbi:MAG TPA: cbb3-type cytochrome oxidase assembly protein CcoS [Bdellovibrio sp.]|nr:cbb3-type cytochrome oxidase assembly protein CcoS [Bdellovibrio sp.]